MICEQPEWPNKAPPHMDVDRLLIQRLQASWWPRPRTVTWLQFIIDRTSADLTSGTTFQNDHATAAGHCVACHAALSDCDLR
jgi:hypothetical protein